MQIFTVIGISSGYFLVPMGSLSIVISIERLFVGTIGLISSIIIVVDYLVVHHYFVYYYSFLP